MDLESVKRSSQFRRKTVSSTHTTLTASEASDYAAPSVYLTPSVYTAPSVHSNDYAPETTACARPDVSITIPTDDYQLDAARTRGPQVLYAPLDGGATGTSSTAGASVPPDYTEPQATLPRGTHTGVPGHSGAAQPKLSLGSITEEDTPGRQHTTIMMGKTYYEVCLC